MLPWPLRGVGSVAVTEPDFLRDTRASYDAIATVYAERFRDELAARPLDRAMLAGFAELVRAAGAGPVADVGCGPGRVTGYLNDLGLAVFGIDLSPEMIAVARRTYPGLRFEVGSMLALDVPDAALGGVLAWYSVIHVPDERVPEAFAEFCRVLAPGGLVLLAFRPATKWCTWRRRGVTRLRSTIAGGSRNGWRSCWAGPGWRCAPDCCANPTTTATSRSGSSRPFCWLVSPRNRADVSGCGASLRQARRDEGSTR